MPERRFKKSLQIFDFKFKLTSTGYLAIDTHLHKTGMHSNKVGHWCTETESHSGKNFIVKILTATIPQGTIYRS